MTGPETPPPPPGPKAGYPPIGPQPTPGSPQPPTPHPVPPPAPKARRFHLGDILTVTTGGILLSPRLMDGMYDILGWLAGEPVWTHQIPRVVREAQSIVLAQHPDLADVVVPEFAEPREQTVPAWLAEQVERFGEHRDVAPMSPVDHTSVDPLAEFRMSYPDKPVIVVTSDVP